ncbi:hypothetical protein Tco_0835694 [Tanacetum coccineum]
MDWRTSAPKDGMPAGNTVGSAHHARSDGVPVSVPIVAPQGLQILLKDAAFQTELLEDESSSTLVRSKSLPMM